VNVAVLLIVAAIFISVPLLVFAAFMLWMEQSAFAAVDEVKASELEGVRVQLLNLPRGPQNRPDVVAGQDTSGLENTAVQFDQDIGPVDLTRPDFDLILAPLLNATQIDPNAWPAVPLLGEIRVRYKDGRRGTIYLYWAYDRPGDDTSPARVYMKVGSNRFRACSLKDLRTVAEAAASRGTKAGR
jgi:hypothetical protein